MNNNSKSPAVLLYTQDFLVGTMAMTHEDCGKYIKLLCFMHQHGRIKEETINVLAGAISNTLKAKFKIDENGCWYNERMEQEAQKRNKFVESRAINGRCGGRPTAHPQPLPKGEEKGKAQNCTRFSKAKQPKSITEQWLE